MKDKVSALVMKLTIARAAITTGRLVTAAASPSTATNFSRIEMVWSYLMRQQRR
jgi:hypothetical protein